jgi:hypothetical protein
MRSVLVLCLLATPALAQTSTVVLVGNGVCSGLAQKLTVGVDGTSSFTERFTDVSPGTHQVTAICHDGFVQKVLATQDLQLPPGVEVRLRLTGRTLQVLGTSALAPARPLVVIAPPAAAPSPAPTPAPVQATVVLEGLGGLFSKVVRADAAANTVDRGDTDEGEDERPRAAAPGPRPTDAPAGATTRTVTRESTSSRLRASVNGATVVDERERQQKETVRTVGPTTCQSSKDCPATSRCRGGVCIR